MLTEFKHRHGTADVTCDAHEVIWRYKVYRNKRERFFLKYLVKGGTLF